MVWILYLLLVAILAALLPPATLTVAGFALLVASVPLTRSARSRAVFLGTLMLCWHGVPCVPVRGSEALEYWASLDVESRTLLLAAFVVVVVALLQPRARAG